MMPAALEKPKMFRFAFAGLLFTSIGLGAETLTGKVVAIADGDTLTLLDGEKKQVKVRLHGIDAPERAQPFYNKAKNALGDLVHEKEVRIEIKGPDDRYGRKIGVVKIGECNVNAKLVKDGWAWHFVKYAPDDKELAAAEKEARKEKRGLWADSKPPVAPWDWRKLSAKEREEKRKGAEKP